MVKKLTVILLGVFPCFLWASGGEGPGDVIIHHILDSHQWKPLPYLPAIPLPVLHVGGHSLSVTGHVLMMWIASALMIGAFVIAFRKRAMVPTGIAGFLEPVVFFVKDDIVISVLGEEMGKKWWPFFNTVFFFILGCNLLGLVPLFTTATGNMSITAGMSLVVLFLIFSQGVKHMGPMGFLKNMIPKGVPWPVVIILLPIEFMGLFIKAFALCLRLFANMIAGHIVIASLLALIFVLHPLAALLSVPFAACIYLLEILVAFIQALVFTLLSCIFIGMACHSH